MNLQIPTPADFKKSRSLDDCLIGVIGGVDVPGGPEMERSMDLENFYFDNVALLDMISEADDCANEISAYKKASVILIDKLSQGSLNYLFEEEFFDAIIIRDPASAEAQKIIIPSPVIYDLAVGIIFEECRLRCREKSAVIETLNRYERIFKKTGGDYKSYYIMENMIQYLEEEIIISVACVRINNIYIAKKIFFICGEDLIELDFLQLDKIVAFRAMMDIFFSEIKG